MSRRVWNSTRPLKRVNVQRRKRRAPMPTTWGCNLGLVQKQLPILRHTHPHPGPIPSDGRGRIVPRRSAYPTALEAARDGSGCSLSRRTGEGQGEGRFVGNTLLVRHLFLHKPLASLVPSRPQERDDGPPSGRVVAGSHTHDRVTSGPAP